MKSFKQLQEVLKKSDDISKWISDFVHSDDPKFVGKSKKERIKMAQGAYYGAQKENISIDEADKMNGDDPCWKGYDMVGTKKKGGKEVPNCVPVKEATKEDLPFTPDAPKKNPSAKAGKYGLGHSIAKHLARQAMKKLAKEEEEDTNENFASDAQRKAVWASKNEKGVKEEVEVSEEYHVVANKSYYGDKSTPVKLSSHKTKDEADAALAKHKANKSGSERWYKTVDSAGLKKHMNEEVEQIDEISKNLALRYYKKASRQAIDSKIAQNHPLAFPSTKKASQNTFDKRVAGIKAAGRRLDNKVPTSEEVEQIDEISKDTLNSYVHKAFAQGNDLHYDLAHSRGNKATDAERAAIKAKISKRNTGVIKAAKKLREEETVLSFDDFMKEQKSCKKEELHPNQKKLDMNKNGKLDKDDFKKLRKEETELDEVTSPMQKLKDAHERHMQKALAANKAGDDEATKVHQQYMQKITAKMNKLKQNEEIDLNEMEELCEISKDTLKSYVKGAAQDLPRLGNILGRLQTHGNLKNTEKNVGRTITNRYRGINKAVEKMTKEEVEELDEISKATLGSYVKKSHDQLRQHSYQIGSRYAKDFSSGSEHEDKYKRKENNREKGIKTAVDKLTKEETEPMLTFKELMENISESKIDDLKDKIAARKATQSAYDKDYKPAAKSNVQKVKGHSYGAGEEEGEDDDDNTKKLSKPAKPEVKRGRGRPAGSKSGARN